ncbi:MAG: lysozyme inhibitor LprI family protein [Novosphingobium sp.]
MNTIFAALKRRIAMDMLKKSILFSVLFGLLAAPASAQNTRDAELATSDRELNQVYLSIIRRLSAEDANKLRTSQRIWIQFRDADCKLAIADARDCLMERTDQRTEQLKSTNYDDIRGNTFSLGSN